MYDRREIEYKKAYLDMVLEDAYLKKSQINQEIDGLTKQLQSLKEQRIDLFVAIDKIEKIK